jgi:transposase
MIGRETRMLLRHYLEEGLTKSALARQLGISRDTIHRWIRSGELDRDLDEEAARYGPRPPVPTKLDPYREMIRQRLEDFPDLTSTRLLEEVRAAGYTGSYTQLKVYVRGIRPAPRPDPLIRFETEPGQQAQVDFAHFKLPWGTRYALLVVLGYSRLLWVRFFERQDMRTVFTGLEAAFASFGGVPREILFDQMRAVITRDLRPEGGRLIENAEFLRFAAHWGFRARSCRPYRAKTKGKVERPIRYLRESFFYGRTFISDADLDEQLVRWLSRTANQRIHGTTRERPLERFMTGERHLLQPLAARPYRSLVLPEPRQVTRSTRPAIPLPRVPVERRPLAAYAQIAGGAA